MRLALGKTGQLPPPSGTKQRQTNKPRAGKHPLVSLDRLILQSRLDNLIPQFAHPSGRGRSGEGLEGRKKILRRDSKNNEVAHSIKTNTPRKCSATPRRGSDFAAGIKRPTNKRGYLSSTFFSFLFSPSRPSVNVDRDIYLFFSLDSVFSRRKFPTFRFPNKIGKS